MGVGLSIVLVKLTGLQGGNCIVVEVAQSEEACDDIVDGHPHLSEAPGLEG